jgi:hypothetical protein
MSTEHDHGWHLPLDNVPISVVSSNAERCNLKFQPRLCDPGKCLELLRGQVINALPTATAMLLTWTWDDDLELSE